MLFRGPELIGRTLGGRYILLHQVGQGGMATIYEAHDQVLDRKVAVKVLLPQFSTDPEFLERFQREARLAASLVHPNIVSIFDVGSDSDAHYIVMELVEGQTLKDLVRREAPLEPGRLVQIGLQLCAALDHAHQRGVVHRDVKPQNILLGPDGLVKVTDFGIAVALGAPSITRTGIVLTSVQYASPEQVRGEPATVASDIYSLGVVLHELATGRLPFEGETPVAIAMKHLNEKPPSPSLLNPALPPGLESVLLRAMAKDPRARFPSARELGTALRSCQRQAEERTVAVPALSGPATPARSQSTSLGTPSPAPAVARRPANQRKKPSGSVWALLMLLLLGLATLGALVPVALLARQVLGDSLLPFNSAASVPSPAPSPVPPTVARSAEPTPVSRRTPAPSPSPTSQPTPTVLPTAVPTQPPASPTPPSRVALPSVVGLARQDAEQVLKALGLRVRVEEKTAVEPAGTVIGQQPPARTSVPAGSEVVLTVSSGVRLVTVPNVIRMKEKDAIRALEQAGLKASPFINYQKSRQPGGTVISTDPAPGRQVPEGTVVHLAVAADD